MINTRGLGFVKYYERYSYHVRHDSFHIRGAILLPRKFYNFHKVMCSMSLLGVGSSSLGWITGI